ncbi:MAG: hypothetical protein KAQ71_02900, partial [Desulfobulbaceae bacterium]|nr:hypothetical protein [Desulfobulbaceae bacterium]
MLIETLIEFVGENKDKVSMLLDRYHESHRTLFIHSDLWDDFELFCADIAADELLVSPLADIISKTQAAAMAHPLFCMEVRSGVADTHYLRFHLDDVTVEEISTVEFLKFKEEIVGCHDMGWSLEIDLSPFERDFPKMTQTRSIGRGVEFLNRRLSGRLSHGLDKGDELILSFLRLHSYQ